MLLEINEDNELVKPAGFPDYLDDPIKEAQKARDYYNNLEAQEGPHEFYESKGDVPPYSI